MLAQRPVNCKGLGVETNACVSPCQLAAAIQRAAEAAWVIIEQFGDMIAPETLPVDVTPDDIDRAREIMVRHGLDTRDALIALDALLSARQ